MEGASVCQKTNSQQKRDPLLCIVAFAFGDGFSNVFHPTNPALLIALGLANVSYGKWAAYSWKFQGLNLLLTSGILLLGLATGYA